MTQYAFPKEVPYAQNGMTLRDWFAGQASDKDIIPYRVPKYHKKSYHSPYRGAVQDEELVGFEFTREQAKYRYADAMLAARNNENENQGE